jgi:hypothetical protein
MKSLLIYALHLVSLAAGVWVLWRTMPRGDLNLSNALTPLALSGAMGLFLLIVSEPHSLLQDFRDAYYAGGASLQAGPQGLRPEIEKGVDGFVNLPIVAYLFWPWGLMPVIWASALFSLVGAACVLATWWLLVRLASLDTRQAAILLFLFSANGPLIYGFKEGNVSHILLLLFVTSLSWLRNNREFAAGLLLGFTAVIKPPLFLLGIYFLARRRWRVACGIALTCVAAGLLSLSVFGWDLHQRWYELCIRPYSDHPLAAFNVQSLQAFVLRLQVGPKGWLDWRPVPFEGAFGVWSTGLVAFVVAAVVLALAMPVSRHASTGQRQSLLEIEFMMILALICIISPISWSHYHAWFLLPFALFVAQRDPFWSSRTARAAGWLGVALLSGPVIRVLWPERLAPSLYAHLSVSLLLIGSVLWLVLLGSLRVRMTARSCSGHTAASSQQLPRVGTPLG